MLRASNLPLRWSGLAALMGGMLHALGDLLNLTHLGVPFAESIGSSLFFVQQTVYLLSAALLLLALVGLYAIQSETTGRLGMVGFLLAFLGTVLFAGAIWALLFIGPLVAAEAPQLLQGQPPASAAYRVAAGGFLVSYGIFALGWLLFGVATLRTHFLPRLAVVFLIIGAVLTFPAVPSPPRTDVILGVAIAWLGLALLRSRGATTQRTSRVRRTS
jgi:hypothetical protein